MNLSEVKTWHCDAGKAIAVNPYTAIDEKYFYQRKEEGLSWGDYYIQLFEKFEQFKNDPANQPSCPEHLSGEYSAEIFGEPVWQIWIPNNLHPEWTSPAHQDEWYKEQVISNGCHVRWYLPLKEVVAEKEVYKGEQYYKQYTGEILDIFYHRFYDQYAGNASTEDKKQAFYEWLNEQIKNTTY